MLVEQQQSNTSPLGGHQFLEAPTGGKLQALNSTDNLPHCLLPAAGITNAQNPPPEIFFSS
jgi:hypothetical protein